MIEKYGLQHVTGTNEAQGLQLNGKVSFGGNSGHQAIHLAYNLGAARILLLGYDYGGGGHFFGEHPVPLNSGHDYQDWLRQIDLMAPGLAAQGVEVINCSRQSAITCFPRMSIAEVDTD